MKTAESNTSAETTLDNAGVVVAEKEVESKNEKKGKVVTTATVKPKVEKQSQPLVTVSVPLSAIVDTKNSRQEPENLINLGYSFRNLGDKSHSLLDMCLSEDIAVLRDVVALFEEHENNDIEEQVKADLSDLPYNTKDVNRTSIVGLARSIAQHGQLQPVIARKTKDGFVLLFGQRRVMALAYAYARSMVDKADKVKGLFDKMTPTVNVNEVKVSDEEGWLISVRENMDRKAFGPIQEGQIYQSMLKRTNPVTGKKFNRREVAEFFGRPYLRVRNYAALVAPFVADTVDTKGRVTKYGRGLKKADREAVERGEKTTSWAIAQALRSYHSSETGDRKTNRSRSLTLAQIQELFDATPAKEVARRKAFAECMQQTLKQAERDSAKRLNAGEAKAELKRVKKASRKTA